MKRILFALLLFFVFNLCFGQINAVVIDKNTNDKVPYVNIWVEDENIGTTSNENGEFNLNFSGNDKTIIFSSIGYETLRINSGLIRNFVRLQPKPIELKEIVVEKNKKRHERVIGKFNKFGLNHSFGCGDRPWMVAKIFKYEDEYNQTPYLKKIKILTNSDIKNAKFNVRFYSINENGTPGDFIYDKNIIATAPKGKKTTEIDLSKFGIIFPKNGFFIILEWLIIDSNRYEFSYTNKGSSKKHIGISYEPSFVTFPSESEDMWTNLSGKWTKYGNKISSLKNYKGKYTPLAIELTLSN